MCLPSGIMLRVHKVKDCVLSLQVRVLQIQSGSLSVFPAASLCVHAFWFVDFIRCTMAWMGHAQIFILKSEQV